MFFVYIFIIGLPAIFVFLVGKKIIKTRQIQQHGIKVHAVITHISLKHFSRGSYEKISLLYQDQSGSYHEASLTSSPGQHKTGDTMEVLYLPENPGNYRWAGATDSNWVLLVFCILLLLFAVFASVKIDEMMLPADYK